MTTPFRVPDPLPPKSVPTPPPPPPRMTVDEAIARNEELRTQVAAIQVTLAAGENMPIRVTASMWVEAKGHTPEAALCGLRREVERWSTAEGWKLDDGKVSVSTWDGEFQAEAALIRTVDW